MIDLPFAVRTETSNFITLSRNSNEIVNLPNEIAYEIAQFNSIDKSHTDYFIIYIKNGLKLNNTCFEYRIKNHLNKIIYIIVLHLLKIKN
jgi:hypothetical protein